MDREVSCVSDCGFSFGLSVCVGGVNGTCMGYEDKFRYEWEGTSKKWYGCVVGVSSHCLDQTLLQFINLSVSW